MEAGTRWSSLHATPRDPEPMKDWTPRITMLVLLLLVIGVPFALRPAAVDETLAGGTVDGDDAARPRLVIITPHNEQIRFEMARGFNLHRLSQNLPAVDFDWRSSGGTSDLMRQVTSEFTTRIAAGRVDDGIGLDLFWGGGDFEHNTLAAGITPSPKAQAVQIVTPVALPEGMLLEVFPQSDIGGAPLYHPQLKWVGVVLASFGIVYNRDPLIYLGLPEPTTWSNLEDPRYRSWVALGDPGHSGSVAAAYNAVLRRMGWTQGWASLRRICANARYFTASGSKPSVDVSAGEAAAGMCIDFFGRFQAGAIGDDRVGYVSPVGMTMTNADPITILRGAPHHDLANEFVIWLLSPEAQGLWQRRIGTPGGPGKFELRRVPIRRDVYTSSEMANWTDPVNPFETARPFAPGMPDFYRPVKWVMQAMAIDVHDELKNAWKALEQTPADDPRRAEMLALFDAMPPDLTLTWPDAQLEAEWLVIIEDANHPRHAEVAATLEGFMTGMATRFGKWRDVDKLLEARRAWTTFYRGNYLRIVELSK